MTEHAQPLSLGRVALTVHDIDAVGAYYEQVVGLHRLDRDGESARYGAEGRTLLELRRDAAARRASRREAGLFHTAFLLPDRGALARWTRAAIDRETRILGASDHDVSEAIYLADPEGNGIEIYADRPASAWRRTAQGIEMSTEALDVEDLLRAEGDGVWQGFPEGTTVGHVHLQVGALPAAEDFYGGVLGLDVTCRYPGSSFFAADGYHHHLATNVWNSRGAGVRAHPATGLAEVEIRLDPARRAAVAARAGARDAEPALVVPDPWGTVISLVDAA